MRRDSNGTAGQGSPWDLACERVLTRQDTYGALVALEPGVNFFVQALEEMGAQTLFSCEGHPKGFYVAFTAPYDVALRVHGMGFFTVEVWKRDLWVMRLHNTERATGRTWSERNRRKVLRWASESWTEALQAGLR